jgi:hypothetical protein
MIILAQSCDMVYNIVIEAKRRASFAFKKIIINKYYAVDFFFSG